MIQHYKYIDKLIETVVTTSHYYLYHPKEKTEIDKDLLMYSIINNSNISDRYKHILELAYDQNMKKADIAKCENVSTIYIDQIIKKAIEKCVHEYTILKAEQNNKFERVQELRLSNRTFHTLISRGIYYIQDIYEYSYIIKELGPVTKKELLDVLKSKNFDVSVFE